MINDSLKEQESAGKNSGDFVENLTRKFGQVEAPEVAERVLRLIEPGLSSQEFKEKLVGYLTEVSGAGKKVQEMSHRRVVISR